MSKSNVSTLLQTSHIFNSLLVTPVWLEPLPGWTNSKNGPQGFLMGASKGVVRRLPTSKTVIYDHIPVDVVVNEVLITAQYINKKK